MVNLPYFVEVALCNESHRRPIVKLKHKQLFGHSALQSATPSVAARNIIQKQELLKLG